MPTSRAAQDRGAVKHLKASGTSRAKVIGPASMTILSKEPYKWTYIDLYKADAVSRIQVLKNGVKPHLLVELARSLGFSTVDVLSMLGVAKSTFNRKLTKNAPMALNEGERVLGFAKIVGQVDSMIRTSGDPTGFDASHWVASWLERPVPALGNRLPKEFLDTSEGQNLVSEIIAKMGSGSYA